MIEVGSYCCSLVERPLPSSNTSTVWAAALCFFGLGIGVMNLALRRLSMIFWVGCPASSSSQCRPGYPYGEFRIGWSKTGSTSGARLWAAGLEFMGYSRIRLHLFTGPILIWLLAFAPF